MLKHMNAKWSLALALALPGLMAGMGVHAQEVAKEWTAFPYLPGQKFSVERAARQSIEARFAADQVDVPFQWYPHSQAVTPRETITDYRFQPLALIKADWTYTYASQQYATEDLFMQAIRSQNASDPQCPAMELEPIQWVEGADKGPDGSSRRDTAMLSGTRYLDFGGGTCMGGFVRGVVERKRRVECPNRSTTQWNAASGMCVMRTAGMMTYKGPPQPKQCPLLGNPCNPATGDKSQPEPDFDLGWISFQRHYHSLTSTAGESLGIGWTHSHNIRLATGSDPMVFPPALSVGLIDPDGNQIAFVKTGNQYEANDGSGDRAVQQASGWQVSRAKERIYFGTDGRMQHRDFEDGTWLAYAYDTRERLLSITHSSGRRLVLHYEAPGNALRISALSVNGEPLVSYGYTANDNLVSATYAGGGVRSYHYEDSRYPNYLTGVSAEDNRRFSWFGYDAKGRVEFSRHSQDVGAAGAGVDGTRLEYLPSGDTVVTDALGNASTYRLTAGGPASLPRMVTGSTDGAGTTATVLLPESTDFRRRVASSTDRRGTVTQYAYAEGSDPVAGAVQITTRTEAAGTPEQRVTETRVALDSNRMVLQTVGAQETRITRNARLQPTAVSVRDTTTDQARVTTLAYCEAEGPDCPQVGLLRSIDGPRADVSDVTTYAWYTSDDVGCTSGGPCRYRKSDLRSITNPLGHTVENLSYDTAGRILSVRGTNGVVTDFTYHARGWLTSTTVRGNTTADDRVTAIDYWPTGQVQQVTEPDGSSVTYVYDAAQRLTDIADSAGNTIHYTLDDAGNRLRENTVDANGTLRRTLARVYNTLGQLTTLKDAGNNATGFAYDANGNPQSLTDALQRVTSRQYDPLNRPAQMLQDVGGVAAEIRSTYNALDQVTQVTDPKGLHTTYAYNGFGDLTGQFSPDSGSTSFTVDSAGNRKTRTDARGITATYSYDALNRLVGVAYPDPNMDVGYHYDVAPAVCASDERFAKGRLSEVLHNGGRTIYCHDRFGQVTRKVQTVNGVASTLRYAYSKSGRLTSLTYPDGSVTDYVRDTLGRISQIGLTRPGQARHVVVNGVTYAAFGPAIGWTYGNGRQLQRPLDLDYRPKAVHDPAAGGLSVGFGYDPVGLIAELKNGAGTVVQAKYIYDALGRLTQTQDGATGTPIETYDYDATGNRTSLTTSAGTSTYSYPADSHHLVAVGGEARDHDAAGNMTNIGGKAFTYNDANRMNAVKLGGAVAERYGYNHRGERVLRAPEGGDAQITVYDEAGQWLGNYSGAGQAQQQAIWLDNYPVALINVPSTGVPELAFVQPDHLGTPRVAVDPVRDVAIWEWSSKSEVFGDQAPANDPDGDGVAFELALRFPGQQATDASGMFYNYQREYEPLVGRYSQSDPIGLQGGISTFSYALARPNSDLDSLGLQSAAARQEALRHAQSPGYFPSNAGYYHPDLGYIPADQGPMLYPNDFLIPGYIALETMFPALPLGTNILARKEPKDARDPNGAKAPGLPGDSEGFCPGKKGPKWVKAPNGRGYGWEDGSGNVWVPTGPKTDAPNDAHGGPHWDVQLKRGGYINVYPGGLRR